MISGIAVWAKHAKPQIKVFCVEPQGKDITGSLTAGIKKIDRSMDQLVSQIDFCPSGKPVMVQPYETLADGMRVQILGSLCYDILSKLCEKEVLSVVSLSLRPIHMWSIVAESFPDKR